MSNANPSRLGQIQGTGAEDAMWLMVFSGEVLTSFEITTRLKGRIRSREIKGAKSAQFPATFRVNPHNHTPGVEILGEVVQANEVVITLDDMVITDTFVDQIDELKNQYDVRAIYAQEHGRAQALFYDRVIANTLVAAARTTTPLFAGDEAGTILTDTGSVGASADFTASGADLISGVNLAKETLEVNQVPVEQMTVSACFKPPQWYLIANSDKNLNRLYGGEGGLARQMLRTVSDIEIIKTIAPLFGYNVTPFNASTNATGIVSNAAGAPVFGTTCPAQANLPYGMPIMAGYPTKYQSDQTNTVGLVWVEPAAGMLNLLGLTMETYWDPRRQGTLMLAKQAIGAGPLRVKCAVELQHA